MKAQTIKQNLLQGNYADLLKSIYLDESLLTHQTDRYCQAIDRFIDLYGEKDVTVFSAPGRSEIGGNHTDHQHGKVLAASINLDAIAIVNPTDDNVIKIVSDHYVLHPIQLDNLAFREDEKATSESLVRGICFRLKELGYQIGGFEAYMTSEVLQGAGLSSSACFEVLVGTILNGLYNEMKIDAVTIAKIGQFAENVYFGKPCGLMDQCASSVGGLITIDFGDVENPVVEKVESACLDDDYCLCITDSKGDHADLTYAYAAIPSEMKKVAQYFGKDYLHEVSEEAFYESIKNLRSLCQDRAVLRAHHFFQENHRVDQEVKALQENDVKTFLQAVASSGRSSFQYLQNVYIDAQTQNLSVALAMSEFFLKDHGVTRVHGGGFEGTIQAFVEKKHVETYCRKMEEIFGEGSCYVLRIRPIGGMQIIK